MCVETNRVENITVHCVAMVVHASSKGVFEDKSFIHALVSSISLFILNTYYYSFIRSTAEKLCAEIFA